MCKIQLLAHGQKGLVLLTLTITTAGKISFCQNKRCVFGKTQNEVAAVSFIGFLHVKGLWNRSALHSNKGKWMMSVSGGYLTERHFAPFMKEFVQTESQEIFTWVLVSRVNPRAEEKTISLQVNSPRDSLSSRHRDAVFMHTPWGKRVWEWFFGSGGTVCAVWANQPHTAH